MTAGSRSNFRPWNEDEDRRLAENYNEHQLTLDQLASGMNRSKHTVRRRITYLREKGLITRKRHEGTAVHVRVCYQLPRGAYLEIHGAKGWEHLQDLTREQCDVWCDRLRSQKRGDT